MGLDLHRYVTPSGNEYDMYNYIDTLWSYSDDEITFQQKAIINRISQAIKEDGKIDLTEFSHMLSDDEFM